MRWFEFVHSRDFTPRVHHIGEYDGRPAEHGVLQRHPFINRNIILDFDAVTDSDVWPNDDILSDLAMPSNPRAFQDMGYVPDARAFADFYFLINGGGRMDKYMLRRTAVRRHFASWLLLERRLTPSKDAQDPKSLLAIRPWTTAQLDALQKMHALGSKRFFRADGHRLGLRPHAGNSGPSAVSEPV